MTRLTNNAGIDLAAAVWLAHDDYDYQDDPSHISVTQLIRPVRQLILAQRVPLEERRTDLVELFDSRVGQALHYGVESAWKFHYRTSMQKLGMPAHIIDLVRINPEKEEPDTIPVYTEVRTFRTVIVNNVTYTLSGQVDLIIEGRLRDVKKTKVYKYQNPGSAGQWKLQGSIYRWLNPEKIHHAELVIQYALLDWSRGDVGRYPDYPAHPLPTRTFPLMGLQETEQWILNRLALLQRLKDAPDDQLPECTEEDLWRGPTQFKYYANPETAQKGGRSTKNFDDLATANNFAAEKGKGVVVPKPGLVRACNYCVAAPICKQRERLFLAGEIASTGP